MKHKTLIPYAILLIAAFTQCTGEENKSGNLSNVNHPTSQNIPTDAEAADILTLEMEGSTPGFLKDYEESDFLTSIGVIEGSTDEMFGEIADITIDSRNRIYILDSRKHQVNVFDAGGEHISSLGREGQGPGEFTTSRSLTMYKDSLLLVSNGYRIEVFDIADKMEFLETINLESPANSLCIIGDEMFVHSPAEDGMIHAYSMINYEHSYTFGQLYKHNNPAVVDRLSAGGISCNEKTSTVVFNFNLVPVVQGYSSDTGELKWVTRIDELNQVKITESINEGRTRITYETPINGIYDIISVPVNAVDQYQVLQVARSSDAETRIYSFMLDSATGKGSLINGTLPRISAVSESLIVSDDLSTGYPTVKIRSNIFN